MKTAVITGASSGLGEQLALAAAERFPEIESFWLISRRADRLKQTAGLLPEDRDCLVLPADLSCNEGLAVLDSVLSRETPDIVLLINAAGLGYYGDVADSGWRRQIYMTDVNVRGLTAVTTMCLPYMRAGAKIINISSIASFCPNARMTVYSSSKAYVTSFSRGLGKELKKRGISVTAVCPGPMDTEFLEIGDIGGNSKTFDMLPYCDVKKVAKGALNAAALGKSVYTPTAFYKFYRLTAKVLPHSIVIQWAKT